MTNMTLPQIEQVRPKERNHHIDVMKGLAILCMVLAHCGFPFGQEIYLFHMAVFFMASGYFYSDKNSTTLLSVGKYVFKKVIALYLPYVLCNGILVLLHNHLLEWGLMTSNEKFLEIGGYGAVWGLKWPYSREFTIDSLKMVLRFQCEPQLGGATWFLRTLFWVSVGHCGFMWVVQKLKWKPLKKAAVLLAVVICCIGAMRVVAGTSKLSAWHSMLYAAYLAYLMGIAIRKAEHLLRYDLQSALVAAVLLFLLKEHGSISLASGWIENLPFYAVNSLLGWILLRSVAQKMQGFAAKAMAYAGKHSMSIVFLHFLSFKVVTLAVIVLRGDDMVLLASFPQLDGGPAYLWVAYTAAGMVLPLAANAAYQWIKRIVIQYVRGVYENIRNRCGRTAGP